MTQNLGSGKPPFYFCTASHKANEHMDVQQFKNIESFFVAGINYKKSDAATRGLFAVSPEQYSAILHTASAIGLTELFVLSTCNRTEIYGFAHSSQQLIELLCSQTTGDAQAFAEAAYIKSGIAAVEHLFQVGAGLDSQILGDYEIVGQLKTAVKFAKEAGFVGAFTERLMNCVLQTSKQIKNGTALSGGTVSVSFAAVQYLRENVSGIASKNILLIGVGKIGRNTCKNLVDYLGTRNITLINRSPEKADTLAEELRLKSAPLEDLPAELKKSDIILVATNATEPTILKSHLEDSSEKWIVDLSIPYNVEASSAQLPHVHLINVDELSKLKDETLKAREAEVPKAKAFIAEGMQEFTEWYDMRQHAPMLKNLKLKLRELYNNAIYVSPISCTKTRDLHIQRVLNETAGKIKLQNRRGCQYITAINDFISTKN